MRYPNARILIFAKAPEPGFAKTRLIPALGAQGAADLYGRLLEFTVQQVVEADLCPIELWCAPDSRHPFFQQLAAHEALTLQVQQGEDLGDRMCHGAETALRTVKMVVLIGADCPLMSAAHLQQALDWLSTGEDAVLGPAEDGGYVLLGLKRNDPRLFSGISWGSGKVLDCTRARLKELGWGWQELPELWDLDRPADLKRLPPSLR
jgi:rSAM/selenodomain-associated transferase 1